MLLFFWTPPSTEASFLGKPSQLQRSLLCTPCGPSVWPFVLRLLPLAVVEQAGELHPLFCSTSLTCHLLVGNRRPMSNLSRACSEWFPLLQEFYPGGDCPVSSAPLAARRGSGLECRWFPELGKVHEAGVSSAHFHHNYLSILPLSRKWEDQWLVIQGDNPQDPTYTPGSDLSDEEE